MGLKDFTLSGRELRLAAIFEGITGAAAMDCFVNDRTAVYVVNSSDMGAALGRRRKNIDNVKEAIGMDAVVIEYSENIKEFVRNAFWPKAVECITINVDDGERVAVVECSEKPGGGETPSSVCLERVKGLVRRHGLDDVVLA